MCSIYILIILGLVVGFIGGYAGFGGAPLIIAFLVLVCGISQLTAQGSVLTMMLGPMTLMGLLAMKNEVYAQWKNIVLGVVLYGIFSYVGAYIAFYFGELNIRIWFAVMLVLISTLQLSSKYIRKNSFEIKQIPFYGMIITGIITGVIGGLFGVGAGVLMVPIFISYFKQEKNYARALSLAILLPPVSIGAFIKYNAEGVIKWNLVLVLFIAYFISNYFGAKLGAKSSDKMFKNIYAGLLIVIATIYLYV